ncbi:MAG: hypothetical protein Q4D06_06760 [Coriobacteriia bacterium]|nr:hypothetical protein [Coriobacteriia bacterium]
MRSLLRDILNSLLTPVASAGLVALFFLAFLVVLWGIMCVLRFLMG